MSFGERVGVLRLPGWGRVLSPPPIDALAGIGLAGRRLGMDCKRFGRLRARFRRVSPSQPASTGGLPFRRVSARLEIYRAPLSAGFAKSRLLPAGADVETVRDQRRHVGDEVSFKFVRCAL
jgi:hypothetical protein